MNKEINDAKIDRFEGSEYKRLKHLKSPQDILNCEWEKHAMEGWLNDALTEKGSIEYNTFSRLTNLEFGEEKIRAMIYEVLSIEFFYDEKYGTGHFTDRYEYNLDRLPQAPVELPSLDHAIAALNKCKKGIPFTAIEYLHNNTSCEATSAIVKELKNFSDHQYCWADCMSTPLWYALSAEGHICEELIDPIIDFYSNGNENATDWIHEQGQYLIGKIAQRYPDTTAQKVLEAMEKSAKDGSRDDIYFLFDVFSFCSIDKYKDRLIALLEQDNISWYDVLASTIAYLQIKEGLPVLKEQLKHLAAKEPGKNFRNNNHLIIEIEEAIQELEKGESLYPDIDIPMCLTRGPWKEEFANAEEYFYDDFTEDNFDTKTPEYIDPYLESAREFTVQKPIIKENKTGRNDPCPCGSGKKYKKCCYNGDIREL
jgi:hypothetical protein